MSLVSRVWRGEITLWKTYWLGSLFLGALSTVCALVALFLAEGYVHHKFSSTTFLVLLIAFAAVEIWRSAGNYQGPAIWKILARIMVVIGVFNLAKQALPALQACASMVEAGYYNSLP
jgi:hypothetical membrane protein